MDECAVAALQVLDALDVRGKVAFLGTSWGGFVGPRVALHAPDRVSVMILFNTSAERGNLLERTRATVLTKLMAIGALDKVTVRMIAAGLLAPRTRRRQPAIGADLTQRLLSWDRRRVIAAVQSVLVGRTEVLSTLPAISIPTLVVSGQDDRTLPTIHSARIVERLPNARHVEVPMAAHLVPLEASQEANRLILDFLHQLRIEDD
jgi:pimeloyl-ACP methyl ester carboxylesterase